MRKNFLTVAVMALCLAVSANAELMEAKAPEAEAKTSTWSAFLGITGGNALIARDGTIFANLNIGVQFNDFISSAAWASFIISDVKNPYVHKTTQLLDYKSFGGLVEIWPLRVNEFSISVPIRVGGGVVNFIARGEEAFKPEDFFFTADMAVHFNYRVTRMLEVSIGGGYRMFAGIESNELDNMDFNTPFGEVRFTIKE